MATLPPASAPELDAEKKIAAEIFEHREDATSKTSGETNAFGLSQEDYDFVTNFPEERRKAVLRKVRPNRNAGKTWWSGLKLTSP